VEQNKLIGNDSLKTGFKCPKRCLLNVVGVDKKQHGVKM
jgi:hypothetical protein